MPYYVEPGHLPYDQEEAAKAKADSLFKKTDQAHQVVLNGTLIYSSNHANAPYRVLGSDDWENIQPTFPSLVEAIRYANSWGSEDKPCEVRDRHGDLLYTADTKWGMPPDPVCLAAWAERRWAEEQERQAAVNTMRQALEAEERWRLRDRFAGQTMQGLVVGATDEDDFRRMIPIVARCAYEMADAMLAARGQKP